MSFYNKSALLDASSLGDDLSLLPLSQLLRDLKIYPHTDEEQTIERLQDCEIAIVNKVELGASHFRALPNLKLIALTATGADNIDINAANDAGIMVCNVRGYSLNSVPQHALTLILMLCTQAHRYHQDIRVGRWSQGKHFSLLSHPITQLRGKSLGLIGYGSLAKQLEKLVAAFEVEILRCNLPGRVVDPLRLSFDELLKKADIVSLHCPLSEHTHLLMGRREFGLMKSSAFLINTARGQLVDELALADALKSGQIAGAGIDVLSQEPPPLEHPLLDPGLSNLIITPHNAWGSYESRGQLLNSVAENIKAFLQGAPINRVNL